MLREGQVTSIDVAACTPTEEASVALKGPRTALSSWGFELALGLGSGDGYRATFVSRGFLQLQEPGDKVTFELAVTRALHDNIDLRLHARRLHAQSYRRWFQSSENEEFFWSVYGVGLDLRAMARLWSGRLSLYLQGGAGLTLGRTRYRIALDQQLRETDQTRVGHTWFPGLHMSLANGAMLVARQAYRRVRPASLHGGQRPRPLRSGRLAGGARHRRHPRPPPGLLKENSP